MAPFYYPLDLFFNNPAAGFVLSYILNSIYFAIIGYVLIGDEMRNATLHKFLIGMLVLTMGGVIANFMPLYAFGIWGVASYAPHFVVNFLLLAVINFGLAAYHFKAKMLRSVILAIIMATLTNAYLVWLAYTG